MKFFRSSNLAVYFLLAGTLFKTVAQERFEPIKVPQDSFEIDGLLNEPAWEKATLVRIENEIIPGNNTPAKVETRGLIAYSDTHLYIGFHAFDKP
ncbi:MAG: hypothetical protein ACO3SY_06120 [Flavobacteriaceae bacterium]